MNYKERKQKALEIYHKTQDILAVQKQLNCKLSTAIKYIFF